jgi:hypothetical protein
MSPELSKREDSMRRVKAATLVICVFIVLLVIFGSCLRATPAGAFFGALAGTPVLVHVFNRLAPQRKEPDDALEPVALAVACPPAEQVVVLRMERNDRSA